MSRTTPASSMRSPGSAGTARVLLLSTPVHASMWSPLDDACGHVRRDEPEVLFEKIRAAGFEIGGRRWTPAASQRITNQAQRRWRGTAGCPRRSSRR